MKSRGQIRKILDKLRRRKPHHAESESNSYSGPIREFAYLDEVSVVSLYSSRFGPLPETLTRTEKASRARELSGEAGVGTSALNAKTSLKSTQTDDRGTEVLSKANVQAHFRELLQSERNSFLIEPADDMVPPPFSDDGDLVSSRSSERPLHWLAQESALQRGELVEIEVEIKATRLFSLRSLMSTITDLGTAAPSMIGALPAESSSIHEVIDQLLVDLIPLECQAVDYRVVPTASGAYVVHEGLLKQLPTSVRQKSIPLKLVGLTERQLYWKDIRRIVFSGGRYRMLARIDRPGLNKSWTEVKFLDLIADISPAMSAHLATALTDALQSAVPEDSSHAQPSAKLLGLYCQKVLAVLQVQDSALEALLEMASSQLPATTPEERDASIAVLDSLVIERTSRAVTKPTAQLLRDEAIIESRILEPAPQTVHQKVDAAFLEVEIIAFYW